MSLFSVFDVTGSGMEAQGIRLNTIASNLANANSVSSSYDETYKARHPVFAAMMDQEMGKQGVSGVQVQGIVESKKPLTVEYNPHHPMADEKGYIYRPNVNVVEEMADMMSASKAYETNIQVADTTKRLLNRVLMLSQGR